MNDVIFVMGNSRLGKKKKAQNSHSYDFDDLPSDDDWIVENEKDGEDVDNFHDEENLFEDLDIPSFANELDVREREEEIEDMQNDMFDLNELI